MSSCNQYINEGLGSGMDGVYKTSIDGGLNVYCDMSSNGGGWTLITGKLEVNPVSWNEGVVGGYDYTFKSSESFSLSQEQIPSDRTQFSISCPADVSDIRVGGRFFNYVYDTGEIAKTLITDVNSGEGFWIHRSPTDHYGGHDPDRNLNAYNANWIHTLTINKAGSVNNFNWSFAPYHSNRASRGYACNGLASSSEDRNKWLVWVR